MKRLQFEAITLAAVCSEIESLVGGKLQAVRQPNEDTIYLELHRQGVTKQLMLCCHAEYFRASFCSRRPGNTPTPLAFCSSLRSNLIGLPLECVQMLGGDRVLALTFGDWTLVAELMGKHSNLILIGPSGLVVAAAKWVGRSKSKRPIQPNQRYERPPVMRSNADVSEFRLPPPSISPRHEVANASKWASGFSATIGPYPFSPTPLPLDWKPTSSMSQALEDYFDVEVLRRELEAKRAWLLSQVERVLLAREVAEASLVEAQESGGKAPTWQRWGELLLAYGAGIPEGAATATVWDYDGSELTLKLDPERSAKDNALRYFEKAKKAKGRLGFVSEQLDRIRQDADRLRGVLAKIETSRSMDELVSLEEDVRKNRWLHEQPVSKGGVAERPYEGHKIREVLGPSNYKILYGETAEANDYLTLRVAKSNDYWLHVRGHTSAHVIVQTQNQPDRVSREVLLAAAKIAVQHSNQKHAGYVPVDYTLKKYVRKPKGTPKGTAHYVNEKTLHVEG